MTPSREETSWHDRWWVVLLLLFFVLGPFGLPLVYRSSQLNRPAKIFLTLLMIPYTGYLIYATVEAVRLTLQIYQQYQGILG